MDLLRIIQKAWGFTGIIPHAITDTNAFGNVIVESKNGQFWRICPEELTCELVAESQESLETLITSEEFQQDWGMTELTETAIAKFGSPQNGRCFCLKVPAVLGGDYGEENLGTITLTELLSFSGDVAERIKDVPAGEQISIRLVD